MRVILVTLTDQLSGAFSILNHELEYRAIFVEDVEPAKKILERVGLPQVLLHPFYELRDLSATCYYDVLVCVHDGRTYKIFPEKILKYGVPQNKFIDLYNSTTHEYFLLERALQYFKERATEFEMFATGLSHTTMSLDVTRFKRKLFNFARGGQDLYYDFQIAKRAVLYGEGHRRILYALIGLSPSTFQFDRSSARSENWRLAQYAISFGDLHNFWMPAEKYLTLFNKAYLSLRLPTEPLDRNNVYLERPSRQFMTWVERLNMLDVIAPWDDKEYLPTRAENIKILDDYLTLCEENNIRPLMFLPPQTDVYKRYFNKKLLDEFHYLIGQACRKHPTAIFIDGWQLQGVSDADFYDVWHMNIYGAAKFSTFLNDFIEQLER